MFHNFSPKPASSTSASLNGAAGPPMQFAGHCYHQIDAASRVEGASPHALVAILFEEVLASLDTAQAALRKGDSYIASDQRFRALSILVALEASLDYRAGGDLAMALARVYREASRLIRSGSDADRPTQMAKARAIISEIAQAWFAIG
jgi:flagellar secretion chaperone FliS